MRLFARLRLQQHSSARSKEENEVSNDSRLGVELKFGCEAGCLFNLNIYQWKGWTNVRATNFGKQTREDDSSFAFRIGFLVTFLVLFFLL